MTTRCPHCGQPPRAGVPISAGDGALFWCTACGMLAITDTAAPEGLRKPTRAERNEVQANPQAMAERASWLHLWAPHKKAERRRLARAGFSRLEFLVLTAVVAIVVGLPLVSYFARGG